MEVTSVLVYMSGCFVYLSTRKYAIRTETMFANSLMWLLLAMISLNLLKILLGTQIQYIMARMPFTAQIDDTSLIKMLHPIIKG